MICLTCGEKCKSPLALARHAKYTHKMTSEEYYNYHFGKKVCSICKGETKFININVGYTSTCSHVCGGIYHRDELKKDKEKYSIFKNKVSKNMISLHKNMSEEHKKIRSENSSKNRKLIIDSLTEEQRKEKFGWLNKLSDDEHNLAVQKITASLREWWKNASESEKEDVYARRFNTLKQKIKNNISEDDIIVFIKKDEKKINASLSRTFGI
jgi:hypothetical protein